jgi:hypothetical protein
MRKIMKAEVGLTYEHFVDGKWSRDIDVIVTHVVPFHQYYTIRPGLKRMWKMARIQCPWLYADKTSHIVRAVPVDEVDGTVFYYVQDKRGKWFSFGGGWQDGRLDHDGSYRKSIMEQIRKEESGIS